MTVDQAGIRAFVEIPEDSWHLFPLFFMALAMELNHLLQLLQLNLNQLIKVS